MSVSALIRVNHSGEVGYGNQPVNRAAFVIHAAIHEARPDIVAAAHSHCVTPLSFQLVSSTFLTSAARTASTAS